MEGNLYIISLIIQAGIIVTAVLSFVTLLVQTYANKKSKKNDETLVELKKNVDYKLEENEKSNKTINLSSIYIERIQITN